MFEYLSTSILYYYYLITNHPRIIPSSLDQGIPFFNRKSNFIFEYSDFKLIYVQLMNRSIAIFFTFIFLLNVIGYYVIYLGINLKADNKATLEIENSTYDRTQTVTIKIPLTLPYPLQNGFERVSGDFEHEGEFYKLVEQKYENDTVYVVCYKNNDMKQAHAVLNDIVKQSTDQSSPNQSSKTQVGVLKDYNPVTEEITIQLPSAIGTIETFSKAADKFASRELPVPTPPPNAVC